MHMQLVFFGSVLTGRVFFLEWDIIQLINARSPIQKIYVQIFTARRLMFCILVVNDARLFRSIQESLHNMEVDLRIPVI